MTEIITGISSQTNFPFEDLDENNAAILELMISNIDIVNQSHKLADSISLAFRIGHMAILSATQKNFDKERAMKAIDHGVASFESISAIIGAAPTNKDTLSINRQATLLLMLKGLDLENYLDENLEGFRREMPLTTEVVSTSAARFYGHMTEYAVLGAALSRKFDIDSSDF